MGPNFSIYKNVFVGTWTQIAADFGVILAKYGAQKTSGYLIQAARGLFVFRMHLITPSVI